MIFLHTSDWHLGATEGERELREDQYFFIDEICRIIEERQVDAVLLAGDVYDRSVGSASAIRLYNYAMERICRDLKKTVLTIAGNHDSADRLSSCGSLLEKAGLYISGAAEREARVVAFDDAEVFLLPWVTEEKVRSLYPEERISDLTGAYQVLTDHMRERFSPDKKHIVVSHAFITNAETSTSDRAAEIGFATQVSASVFDGFDYVALGHIHKPQNVNGHIRYSGTPMPYSFGKEESQEKSVTLLDTETMTQEIVPLPLLHQRRTLTGTYEELLNPDCPEEARTGYVRLNVTDTALGLELLSRLRQVYPHPLVVSGKAYEGDGTSISLTMEEFEQMENDPSQVFRSFCREEMGQEATPHFVELFEKAVSRYEEGTV
ncbi:MAG: exonuclease SbcCD subunit D [bacterium]|nr:exonuclease SbcCD subunit D [bacterium]MDY4634236.1 exonuclease SbcCD subunit D [Candidatus Limivicinus sp.]